MHAGCVIGFARYALDHKYPNEMWVYAPAGRGHTHTWWACSPADRSSFSLCVQCAFRIVRRAEGSPVLGGDMCRE